MLCRSVIYLYCENHENNFLVERNAAVLNVEADDNIEITVLQRVKTE
jgi:hypothetical protein